MFFPAGRQHEARRASHAGFDAKAEILQLGADFEAVVAGTDQKRDRGVRRKERRKLIEDGVAAGVAAYHKADAMLRLGDSANCGRRAASKAEASQRKIKRHA